MAGSLLMISRNFLHCKQVLAVVLALQQLTTA